MPGLVRAAVLAIPDRNWERHSWGSHKLATSRFVRENDSGLYSRVPGTIQSWLLNLVRLEPKHANLC